MEVKKFKDKVHNVLKKENRLWNEEKTELNQTLLLDILENFNEKNLELYESIISLFLEDEELKSKFFLKVNDVFVFKTNDFKFFMEENKVYNSFTQYKNRIGLTDGKRFLKDSADVVLNFPYKDCVLEGGQSSEEGLDSYYEYDETVTKTDKKKGYKAENYNLKQSKRNEIFFNQILAKDEIDRLFDKKAFVSWKRFTTDGEVSVGEIKRDEDGTIKENLIIKGNNLLALHSLKELYTERIKMIYIDPPYYFSKKLKSNDSFVYNSNFKLSTWLSFMKVRLEVAKILMKDDGIIFVSIDDGGQSYLKVLMDEVFGMENFVANLPTIMNLKGNNDEFGFSGTHEYTLVFAKKIKNVKLNEFPIDEEEIFDEWESDEIGFFKKGAPMRATGEEDKREDRKEMFYPILIKNDSVSTITIKEHKKLYNKETDLFDDKYLDLLIKNYEEKGYEVILPFSGNKFGRWRWGFSEKNRQKLVTDVIINRTNDSISLYKKQRPTLGELPTKKPKSIFYKPEYSSGNGTAQIKEFFGEKVFNNPKPMDLIKDFILLGTKKDDIILDYHSGSGTTGHAILQLNKEDNGNRKFILIEQMNYINTITIPRIEKVIKNGNINDSFIFCELAPYNEKAKEEVNNCNTLKELEKLFDTLYDKYFLNYNLKVKEFKEKVLKEENFKALTLEQQKEMFLTMLDLNQMYVQYSEMTDSKYCIDKVFQELTNKFYSDK